MNVSLIIVHWNTPLLLLRQIKRLPAHKSYEIIIVDNASDKESQVALQSLRRLKRNDIHLILNSVNKGFAAACNQGARKAAGDWLFFLNPDVTLTPGSLDKFVQSVQKQGLDAATVLTDNDQYNKPVPSAISLLVEFTPLKFLVSLDRFKEKTLTGGCLLIRKKVLEDIGYWDEDFFLWFEDSDLTYRLLKGNYKTGRIESDIRHTGGESFKKLTDKEARILFFTSMGVYARKHFTFFGRMVVSLLKLRYT